MSCTSSSASSMYVQWRVMPFVVAHKAEVSICSRFAHWIRWSCCDSLPCMLLLWFFCTSVPFCEWFRYLICLSSCFVFFDFNFLWSPTSRYPHLQSILLIQFFEKMQLSSFFFVRMLHSVWTENYSDLILVFWKIL